MERGSTYPPRGCQASFALVAADAISPPNVTANERRDVNRLWSKGIIAKVQGLAAGFRFRANNVPTKYAADSASNVMPRKAMKRFY
mgnify:FL=1